MIESGEHKRSYQTMEAVYITFKGWFFLPVSVPALTKGVMTSLCNLYIACRKSVDRQECGRAKSFMLDGEKSMTRLEISQMAPRPNHWSPLMAIDVIIVDVYLILLCHLRGIREE